MRIFSWTVFFLLCLTGIWWIVEPVFSGEYALLASFDDDAFYYFKVAENIVAGYGSTFNGIHQTNGYHPLWMILLVFLDWLAEKSGAEFLEMVRIGIALLYMLFLFFSFLFIQKVRNRNDGFFDYFYLAFCAGFYVLIAGGGMEVALTLPLIALLFLLFISDTSISWLIIVGALTVLSRLDSVIVVAPFFFYLLWVNRLRFSEILPGILVAAVMVLSYIVSNLVLFDIPVPVSGFAKSASGFALFSPEPWISLFSYVIWRRINLFTFLVLFVAAYVFLKQRKCNKTWFLFTLFLGVILFYLLTVARSDWQMWPWYFYPDFVAFTFSYLMVSYGMDVPIGRLRFGFLSLLIILSAVYCSMYAFISPIFNKPESSRESVLVSRFMDNHPGVYAMGDRAGRIGYLSHQPLIQLEGLVMDANYLKLLRSHGMTIDKLLKIYGVDYYIVSVERNPKGCYDVVEPYFGGTLTKKVRGTFCVEPYEDFREHENITGLKVFFLSRSE